MRIIFCVTNDIVTDQRIHRITLSLSQRPAEILVTGISLPGSLPLPATHFTPRRLAIIFSKGPFFYACYNVRLFFFLLFKRADLLVANDLDTLPAVSLVAWLKRRPLVYDSHEYFTGLPELVNRPVTRKVWEVIEVLLLPHVKFASTVSDSIAAEYSKKYGLTMEVIRNLPKRIPKVPERLNESPGGVRTIIYQGALNMGRGLELALKAMQYANNCRLVIAGSGTVEPALRELAENLRLGDRVWFLGKVSPEELLKHTLKAHLGISLEESKGLNYHYALPNKLFDYIQARVPVLVSDLPEMAAIVNHYNIGRVTNTADPRQLAAIFEEMLTDLSQRRLWLQNLEKASAELCWEKEEHKLLALYNRALENK